MRSSIAKFKRSEEIRPLRIILDYETLKSDASKRILEYAYESCFEFIALGDCSFPARAVLGKDERGVVNKITLIHDDQITGEYGFGWLQSDIQNLARHFEMRDEDLMVLLQFIALTRHSDEEAILITECKKLLDRKRWGQTFGDVPHNRVLSPEAASIFMDLYIKSHKYYILFPHTPTNAVWLNYLYSMKNKISNLQRPWSIAVCMDEKRAEKEAFIDLQQSLSDRLTDMLSAIDQMGKAFYFERGNDKQDTLVYHFNYWISLYEGVFDNIAALIDYRYSINFNDPIKISLRGSIGGDFLTQVEARNSSVRPYLRANAAVLNLATVARNKVIHTTRLRGLHYSHHTESFELEMMQIPKVFYDNIRQVAHLKGNKLNKWGHFEQKFGSQMQYFLEPFAFSQQATIKLFNFVDGLMPLLDFDEYLTTYPETKKGLKEDVKHKKELELFNQYNLGY